MSRALMICFYATGIFVWAIWAFGFSRIYYELYILAGSPTQPTAITASLIPILSFLISFIPSVLAVRLMPSITKVLLYIYIALVTLPSVVLTFLISGCSGLVGWVFSDYGWWAYVFGAIAGVIVGSSGKQAT